MTEYLFPLPITSGEGIITGDSKSADDGLVELSYRDYVPRLPSKFGCGSPSSGLFSLTELIQSLSNINSSVAVNRVSSRQLEVCVRDPCFTREYVSPSKYLDFVKNVPISSSFMEDQWTTNDRRRRDNLPFNPSLPPRTTEHDQCSKRGVESSYIPSLTVSNIEVREKLSANEIMELLIDGGPVLAEVYLSRSSFQSYSCPGMGRSCPPLSENHESPSSHGPNLSVLITGFKISEPVEGADVKRVTFEFFASSLGANFGDKGFGMMEFPSFGLGSRMYTASVGKWENPSPPFSIGWWLWVPCAILVIVILALTYMRPSRRRCSRRRARAIVKLSTPSDLPLSENTLEKSRSLSAPPLEKGLLEA